jgi:uncharacterized protein (TIRG00374 family)
MVSGTDRVLKALSVRRIILPIILGLAAAAWGIASDFDINAFRSIKWSWNSTFWIIMAALMGVIRDLAYIGRIRVLTDSQISWYRCFIIIMLWEFASALTPGLLGGGFFVAIFILNREKVNMGKSITAVLYSSFLDGLFLAVMGPLVYFLIGKENLFSNINPETLGQLQFLGPMYYTFWVVYFIILAYKLLVAYALFINPKTIQWLLLKIFSIPFLQRWKPGAIETGEQLLIASKGLKHKNFRYWFLSLGTTFISWTARYSIVNCLVLAIHPAPVDNLILYGRQVVMGIIILVSPTPGGAGLAEVVFSKYLADFIPMGLADASALLWRLMSYYPYLVAGAIILPGWLQHVFGKHHEEIK